MRQVQIGAAGAIGSSQQLRNYFNDIEARWLRKGHKEFARFLNFSLSSLKEVEDGLIEAVDNEWLTEDETEKALNLCERTTVATSRLRNSNKDKPDPPKCM